MCVGRCVCVCCARVCEFLWPKGAVAFCQSLAQASWSVANIFSLVPLGLVCVCVCELALGFGCCKQACWGQCEVVRSLRKVSRLQYWTWYDRHIWSSKMIINMFGCSSRNNYVWKGAACECGKQLSLTRWVICDGSDGSLLQWGRRLLRICLSAQRLDWDCDFMVRLYDHQKLSSTCFVGCRDTIMCERVQ